MPGTISRQRFWRRETSGNHFGLELDELVSTIAEWLILAVSAATERDRRPSGAIKLVAKLVEEFELAFDPYASMISDDNFCRHVISLSLCGTAHVYRMRSIVLVSVNCPAIRRQQ